MNTNFDSQIKNAGQQYKVEPKDVAWSRIDAKIKNKSSIKQKMSFGNWSVAANLAIFLLSTMVITFYINKRNPNLFLCSDKYSTLKMEELNLEEDAGIYARATVEAMHAAYK